MSQNFGSVYPLQIGGATIGGYSAFWALIVNFVLAIVLTWIFAAMKLPAGADHTAPADYTALSPAPALSS